MKKGYTLIEVILVLGCLATVVIGGFVLYSQYTSTIVDQTIISRRSTSVASAFLTLNDAIQNCDYIEEIDGNTIDLGNNTLRLDNNTIYLGDKQIYKSDNQIEIKVDENKKSITMNLGGETHCFRSIRTET